MNTCILIFVTILVATNHIQAYPQPQSEGTDPAWKDILDGSTTFQIFRIEVRKKIVAEIIEQKFNNNNK